MASVLAGTTHAAVSSVLIIFEMTGDYGVILPLMLSAAVAAATSRAIEPDSLYTAPLRRRGVALPELPRPEWLRATAVRGARRGGRGARIGPTAPFEEVLKRLLALPPGHDLYVTSDGRAAPRRHPARRAQGHDLGGRAPRDDRRGGRRGPDRAADHHRR